MKKDFCDLLHLIIEFVSPLEAHTVHPRGFALLYSPLAQQDFYHLLLTSLE